MAIVLFNPTNERFEALHAGLPTVIEPFGKDGHKVRVEDSKAHHILNSFGPRGLCLLEYGDEGKEAEIAAAGLQRNKEFKTKQISRYNQDNERRKQTNLAYIEPPQQIKDYSVETGLKLITPYETTDAKNTEIMELRRSNEAMRSQMDDLMSKMASMLNEKSGVPDETADDIRLRALIAEFDMKQKPEFKQWCTKNKDRFQGFPLVVQEKIDAKWARMFGSEERPT